MELIVPESETVHKYFSIHGEKIELDRFRLMYDDVSCSGRFCDRCLPQKPDRNCGCWDTGRHTSPMVGEWTLSFEIENRSVPDMRSLRTTELFFEDFANFSTLDNCVISAYTMPIRELIKEMVNHVNHNGGWTIIGWFKNGDRRDASSDEMVATHEATIHVSLLIPSSVTIRQGQDAIFESKQIAREACLEIHGLDNMQTA